MKTGRKFAIKNIQKKTKNYDFIKSFKSVVFPLPLVPTIAVVF
jgi:hypothetical protein